MVVCREGALHAGARGHLGTIPVAVDHRIDGDGLCRHIVLSVQLHAVEQAVLARPQQRIRLGVHQRRAVRGIPAPGGEFVAAIDEQQHAAVDQAEHAHADLHRLAIHRIDALAAVQQRIAARIHGDAALDRRADVDGIPGGLAVLHVKEVNMAIQRGVDHLDQVLLGLLLVIDVHDVARLLRPAHTGGLSRPADAAPLVDAANLLRVHDFQLAGVLRYRSISRGIPEVVAAEGGDALHLRVRIRPAEHHRILRRIFADPRSVLIDLRLQANGRIIRRHRSVFRQDFLQHHGALRRRRDLRHGGIDLRHILSQRTDGQRQAQAQR